MRATWLRSAHWPPQSPARPMSSVAPLTLRQRSRPGRPSSRRGVNDRGVGHPAALTHLAVVPRSRPRGLTPIRTPISSPCPSASTNKPAAQRVPAGIQTCSAGNWGSSGRRFKSCQPDRRKGFDLHCYELLAEVARGPWDVLDSSTCQSPPGRSSVPSPCAVNAEDRCGPASARCWEVRRRRR
jgi:hypothetical protein